MMTPAQLATFKADIEANGDAGVIQALLDGDSGTIAAWYNQQASPDFYVFRVSVSPSEVGAVIELDDVANMTAGDVEKLNSFFILRPGGFDGSSVSDRAGFDDVLSVAAADESQQAVAALWQRLSNNVEKLLATGTGSLVDPALASFTGNASVLDVSQALQS